MNCGYCLTGLGHRSARCPECGAPSGPPDQRIELNLGLGLLIWGLGLAILAFLLSGSLWAAYTWGESGTTLRRARLLDRPVLAACIPAVLGGAGLRVMSGCVSGRSRAVGRAGAAALVALAVAAALALTNGSAGVPRLSALLGIGSLASSQVLPLLERIAIVSLLGAGLWWGSECRRVVAHACEAAGLAGTAARLRLALLAFPIVVFVAALALEFESSILEQIPRDIPSAAALPPRSNLFSRPGMAANPWHPRAQAGFGLARAALWGVVLFAAAGTWQAAVMARARLAAAMPHHPTAEP